MKNSRWFAFARNTSWIAALLLLLVAAGFAQRRGGFGGGGFGGGFGGLRFEGHDEAPRPVFPSAGEFHFIRLQFFDAYQSRGFGFASRNGMGSGWWIIDWPDAEDHFSLGVQRLTRIEVGESKNLPILDDHLFDYPWIYATNVGNLTLNGDEASRLREYLLRGGFLVVDDFWGPEEWEVFREAMNHVFPNQATPDIPNPIPSCMFSMTSGKRIVRSSPERGICAGAPMDRSSFSSLRGRPLPGAPCTTAGIALSWPSITTQTLGMPGNMPIHRNIRNT